MACSAKIRLRTHYGKDATGQPLHTRHDGTAAVNLQVVLNGEVLRFPIGQHWPPAHFDEVQGLALPRHRGDKEAADLNLVAGLALGRAHEILGRFRAQNAEPTPAEFRREYDTRVSRVDFVSYLAGKALERWRSGDIQELTYKAHLGTLSALRAFAGKQPLPFASLDRTNFATKFEAYLVRKGKRATTRWARHKDVKCYLKLARKDEKIAFADPYANFKVKKVRGGGVALAQRDVRKIDAYYRRTKPGDEVRPVLRRWLFSLASCGLRISDAKRVERDWRIYDLLIFRPWKGRKSEDKVLKVPLSRRAQELWDEALRERDHPRLVFTDLSGQKANDWLKWVAAELGIQSRIFNHQARRTYATQYLANGGLLHVLQENLGHTDIEHTMIYVDVLPEVRESETRRVDAIFATPAPDFEPQPAPMRPVSWFLARGEG